jgi:hypothetical protein
MIKGITVVNSWVETSPLCVAPSISLKRARIAAAGRFLRASANRR